VGADSFGALATESLVARGVDTGFLLETPGHATGATIVLNHFEDRAMVTYMGAMAQLTLADCTPERLGSARHLHFASVFLQPGLRPDVQLLFRRAKELGLTTSFDPQWDPAEGWDLDLRGLLPYVDVFLPNETELLHLTGERTVAAGLAALQPFANIVAVKLGAEGSVGQRGTEQVRAQPFPNRNVVDAIGAGDSFDAGFISRFIRGEALEACLLYGNLMGAVSTTAPGGTGAFSSLQDVLDIARERFRHGA
jgi:sugar/nucleoside kinase (ribokinase family)